MGQAITGVLKRVKREFLKINNKQCCPKLGAELEVIMWTANNGFHAGADKAYAGETGR